MKLGHKLQILDENSTIALYGKSSVSMICKIDGLIQIFHN